VKDYTKSLSDSFLAISNKYVFLFKFIRDLIPTNRHLIIVLFFIFFNGVWYSTSAQFENIKAHYKDLQMASPNEPVTIQFVQEEMRLLENYTELSQIILLRHGEPELDKGGWRKRKEAIKFIKDYDSVGVYSPGYLPVKLHPDEIDIIFTSTLNRSVSTADQLFKNFESQQAHAIFREFERKIFSFPNVKLPLKWWLTSSRVFWLMGFNKKALRVFRKLRREQNKL